MTRTRTPDDICRPRPSAVLLPPEQPFFLRELQYCFSRFFHFTLTLYGSIECYIIPVNTEEHKRCFHTKPTIISQGASAMKEKTAAALHILFDLTAENLGFVAVWAVSLAVILKLACA